LPLLSIYYAKIHYNHKLLSLCGFLKNKDSSENIQNIKFSDRIFAVVI